jgi:tRNA threonylcarbamoyladenosine biosynthesis protein TsaB
VLQAGRKRIAIAFYRWRFGCWQIEEEPRLTTWTSLAEEIAEPTLFCGEIDEEGANLLARLDDRAIVLSAARRLRRAGFLAELGWQRISRGEVDDPATLTPTYLKHPV